MRQSPNAGGDDGGASAQGAVRWRPFGPTTARTSAPDPDAGKGAKTCTRQTHGRPGRPTGAHEGRRLDPSCRNAMLPAIRPGAGIHPVRSCRQSSTPHASRTPADRRHGHPGPFPGRSLSGTDRQSGCGASPCQPPSPCSGALPRPCSAPAALPKHRPRPGPGPPARISRPDQKRPSGAKELSAAAPTSRLRLPFRPPPFRRHGGSPRAAASPGRRARLRDDRTA